MSTFKCIASATILAATLSGCYVVPLDSGYHGGTTAQQAYVAVVRPPFSARLYPANDAAAALGRITGSISNPERGQGQFAFILANEAYQGEATRAPGSTRGSANAAGNRGGFVRCDYTMGSSSLGTGTCTFSNGAVYDIHLSI